MKNIILIILTYCTLTTLLGCAMKHEPSPTSIEPLKLPLLNVKGPIEFINGQKPGTIIDVPASPYTINLDLHEYTDSVIALITKELVKKDIPVIKNADKVIKISVVDVWLIPQFASFKGDANLTVEIKDSKLFGFEVSTESWNYQKAIDDLITEAAVHVLNHKMIIQYLEK